MPPAAPPPPPQALHFPVEGGEFRMAMGLLSCPEAEWLEIDARYDDEMAERRQLLATRRAEVLAAQPGAEAACAELLVVLADHLVRHHAPWFTLGAGRLANALTGETWRLDTPEIDPLELAGRLVQEDFCIIRPAMGGPVLEAAVLCAPSRWRLAEKIGHPLQAVHGPVPLYGATLGAPVDRFMAALKPGRIAMRMNWSVVDDPALFQPWGKHRTQADPGFTEDNVAARLFFRSERQTFRRLDASGTVAFGIRVHSYKLARIAADPVRAARLAEAVRALPEAMRAYKSLPVFEAPLLGFLDRASRAAR